MTLAVLSVFLLIFELTLNESADTYRFITTVDLIISAIFLADFIRGHVRAEDKKAYWKSDWYLLLASIPVTAPPLRALSSTRLLRIIRIVRILARLRKIDSIAGNLAARGEHLLQLLAVSVMVVFTGSVVFFTAEFEANDSVTNFFDAVWWAVVTATTVGYGDITPVTSLGRITAMAMMIYGVGVLGSVAGITGGIATSRYTRNSPTTQTVS